MIGKGVDISSSEAYPAPARPSTLLPALAVGMFAGAVLARWEARQDNGTAILATLLAGSIYPMVVAFSTAILARLTLRPGIRLLVLVLVLGLFLWPVLPFPGALALAILLPVLLVPTLGVWVRSRPRGLSLVIASLILCVTLAVAGFPVGPGIRGGPQPLRPPRLSGPSTAPALLIISIDALGYDVFQEVLASLPPDDPLSRWVAGGTRFHQARANAPWTLPSMATVMTGMPPSRHGAGFGAGSHAGITSIRGEAPLLAERLRDAGFVTSAIATNPYLSRAFGFSRGFDAFREQDAWEREAVGVFRRDLLRFPGELLLHHARADARHITALASDQLSRLAPGRFMLWAHYIDPHAPYQGGSGLPTSGWQCFEEPEGTCFSRTRDVRSGLLRLDPGEQERIRHLYVGDVQETLAAVSTLIGHAEALGLGPRMWVALLGDHGEEFWEHGGMEHGHSLYDEVLRVPLVIAGPGLEPADIHAPVSLDRVAPTLLRLAGADPMMGATGLPLDPASGDAFVSEFSCLLFGAEQRAVVAGSHKLIVGPGGREEVYDLVADPRETRNQAACAPVPEALRLVVSAPLHGDTIPTEQLRTLGYMD